MPHGQHFLENKTTTWILNSFLEKKKKITHTHTRGLFYKPGKFIRDELLWWHHSWQVSLFNLAQERRHPQVWHYFFQTRLKPACQHVSQKYRKKLVPANDKTFLNKWTAEQIKAELDEVDYKSTLLDLRLCLTGRGDGLRGVFVFSEPLDELCNPISPSRYAVACGKMCSEAIPAQLRFSA